jgi:acyl carrier protein
MKKRDFLELLKETMGMEEDLEEEMLLEGIEEYDSLAALSLMAMYDELGVNVIPKDFRNLKRVKELVALAGENVNNE